MNYYWARRANDYVRHYLRVVGGRPNFCPACEKPIYDSQRRVRIHGVEFHRSCALSTRR